MINTAQYDPPYPAGILIGTGSGPEIEGFDNMDWACYTPLEENEEIDYYAREHEAVQ